MVAFMKMRTHGTPSGGLGSGTPELGVPVSFILARSGERWRGPGRHLHG